MPHLPRPTLAAVIGAAVLSALAVGTAVGPARAAEPAVPSNGVGGSSNAAVIVHYAPVRM